nr:hypothetical protein CTI12_AA159120 [Tanacetum cinerariifolium]
MTCSNCLKVGHNKKTCDKDPVPKTPKPRKPPGRRSQTKSVSYASSRGKGRGSRGGGRGARGAAKGGTGRGRVGQRDKMKRRYNKLWKKRKNIKDKMRQEKVHTASGVVEPLVRGVYNASDVVEPAVTEGLDQEEMIDKVVIAEGVSMASNTRDRNKGKKVASKTAPALPFKIYHKNRVRSERIAKMQAKKFKIDDHGTSLSADKALNLSESE